MSPSFLAPFLLLGALGCASPSLSTPLAAGGPGAQAAELRASGTLVLAASEDGPSLAQLLDEYARLTGTIVCPNETARTLLEVTRVQLAPVEVPADEVVPFVESILLENHVLLTELHRGEVTLLGVHTQSSQRGGKPCFKLVPEDELERYAGRPALLIWTVVELPHTDVRQLSTSMRALLTDTQTQTLLPVGSRSILLGGSARDVLEIVAMMRVADAAEADRAAERARTAAQAQAAGAH